MPLTREIGKEVYLRGVDHLLWELGGFDINKRDYSMSKSDRRRCVPKELELGCKVLELDCLISGTFVDRQDGKDEHSLRLVLNKCSVGTRGDAFNAVALDPKVELAVNVSASKRLKFEASAAQFAAKLGDLTDDTVDHVITDTLRGLSPERLRSVLAKAGLTKSDGVPKSNDA